MSHRNSSGTQQACASCKFQRRKCAPDCILAPYFPHDRQLQFLNAHKLFGVRNITKLIRNLQPHAQSEAMQTIIFQSDARAHDPVGGCLRIIRELEREIDFLTAEYNFVLHQLSLYRAQASQSQPQSQSQSNDYPFYYQQQQQQAHHHNLFLLPNDQQEQYMRILQEDGEQDHVNNNLSGDPRPWVIPDSTLSLLNIKDQFVNDCDGGVHDDHGANVEMKPIIEASNNYERNHLIFGDQNTIQQSDRDRRNSIVLPEEKDPVKNVDEDHDFEAVAASLFPLTSCIASESNDLKKRLF